MLKTCRLLTVILLACGLSGCDRGAAPATGGSSAATAPAAAVPTLPADLFATAEPPGARDVLEAKAAPQVGDEVTVRGRIGGRKEPFVEGRAMFTLVELALPTCNEKHGDGCPTPWDYCCEPATEVVRQSLTVQVPGPDGKALRVGLAGTHGLKPMAEVVVTGRIAKVEEGGVVVVDARRIWVKG